MMKVLAEDGRYQEAADPAAQDLTSAPTVPAVTAAPVAAEPPQYSELNKKKLVAAVICCCCYRCEMDCALGSWRFIQIWLSYCGVAGHSEEHRGLCP